MKTYVIAFGIWLVSTLAVLAQTFQVIHHFTPPSSAPYPNGQLLVNGDTLYGTTGGGGSAGYGSVFKLSTNGAVYQVIKSFSAPDVNTETNTDGAEPMAGLIIFSNTLFGTTFAGGSGAKGTVFNVSTDGTSSAVLTNFFGVNGKNPYARLTLCSNTIYGTTAAGGISNKGAIFQINPDGTGFRVIKSFLSSEGILLMSGVTLGSNTLYGTTLQGGISNGGTIYSIGTDGNGFTVLRTLTNTDGTQPRYDMVLSDNTLYGITQGTGTNNGVFRINTDGSSYTVIKRFSQRDPVSGTNWDGSYIWGGMAMWNGVLYGTTEWGGFYGNGVVFKVNPDGTGFAVLRHFSAATGSSGGYYLNSDGIEPRGDVTVANGILYGTTILGGIYGAGTAYSLTIPPTPILQVTNLTGSRLIFWSDDGLNRVLQTTTDLASGYWTNVTALNWTNAVSNPQQIGYRIGNSLNPAVAFFRLQ